MSSGTVYNVLEKHGIARRSASEVYEARWPLSEVQEEEACRRYEAGETAKTIARKFGVSDATIFKALDRYGIPRNFRGVYESAKRIALRVLSSSQEAEACRRYEAGESVPALAEALGVGTGAIIGTLRRNGVEMRAGVAGDRLGPEIEADVCSRYLAGESSEALAKEFGVSAHCVLGVLERNGVKRRPGVAGDPLAPEQVVALCHRYAAGEKPKALARAFGISPGSVLHILQRRSVPRRYWKSISPEREAEICHRYLAGNKVVNIAADAGIHIASIYSVLKRNRIFANRNKPH